MEKGNSMPKYLTKLVQCRDAMGSVDITIVDDDLVSLSLLELPKSWHSYQDSINGREKLPDWERLWSDLVQEEFRRNTKDGYSSKMKMKEIFLWLPRQRRGKEIISIPNPSPNMERSTTCPK